jgi:3-oxoacyl-[acyl-carrier-protein] synthase-3
VKPIKRNLELLATGSYAPERIITNEYFSEHLKLNTSADWIAEKTGIRSRRYSTRDNTSDMAAKAAELALSRSGIERSDVGFVIVATVTPDCATPCTAAIVAEKLGLTNLFCFDVNNACAGFIFALDIASRYVASGDAKYGLVIGADLGSRCVDFESRDNCYFFADGAGAVVVGPGTEHQGIVATTMETTPLSSDLNIPGGVFDAEILRSGRNTVHMNGQVVKEFALSAFVRHMTKASETAGCSVSDLAAVIPHQANMRIIEAAAVKMSIPKEKLITIVTEFGNTMGASIPMALDTYMQSRKNRHPELIALVGFGAGLSSACTILSL